MAKGHKKKAGCLKCEHVVVLFTIGGLYLLATGRPDQTSVIAAKQLDMLDKIEAQHVAEPALGFAPFAKTPISTKGVKRQAPAPAAILPKHVSSDPGERWTPSQVVSYMDAHPSRAYFAHLFSKGGFKMGIEVGVADGRFSEHMLLAGKPAYWTLVEPFPNEALISRYPPAGEGELNAEQKAYRADRANQPKELAKTWSERGIDKGTKLHIFRYFSTDSEVISGVPKGSIDFIYLDGAHDYKNVKKELEPYWQMLAPGGVLAGHDYQNHGDEPLDCKGCDNIPRARTYTEWGEKHGKKAGGTAANMNKVVKAVQEWVSENHPDVVLHHTMETFTRETLAADGLDYDLVITNTFNPSWYFVKDLESDD